MVACASRLVSAWSGGLSVDSNGTRQRMSARRLFYLQTSGAVRVSTWPAFIILRLLSSLCNTRRLSMTRLSYFDAMSTPLLVDVSKSSSGSPRILLSSSFWKFAGSLAKKQRE